MKSIRHWLLERLVARRPRLALQLSAAHLNLGGVQLRLPPGCPLHSAAGGEQVALPLDDIIAPYVMDHGSWQPEELAFMAEHAPSVPAVLVDVGANIGLVTRQLVQRLPGIAAAVCFEPHPGNFQYLQRNLAHLPQCRLVQAALGQQAGELRFYEDASNFGNHSLNLDAMQGAPHRTTLVQCLQATEANLLGALPATLAQAPILWKSDTQGFDEAIVTALPDSFWSRVAVGVMEIWQIDRPAFDAARLGAILSVDEVVTFASARSGGQHDLFFARPRA